jgi:hypothetical protein
MTCISLRSGFWLSKICDASMPDFSYLPKTPLKSLLVVGYEKKAKIQMPLVMYCTHWAIERIIWGTYICFTKLIKPLHKWLIEEWMIGDSIITFLSCNHPITWKRYTPHGNKGKGWIKMPTYLNCGRMLCYKHHTCELYQHSSTSWSTTKYLAICSGRAKVKLGELVGGH